jgi:hypothetical protein
MEMAVRVNRRSGLPALSVKPRAWLSAMRSRVAKAALPLEWA